MDWNAWRRRWMTEPLYRRVRNGVQPFNSFQRHVMASGDPWWESLLLSGQPDWNALTYVRPVVLKRSEAEFMDGPVAALCQRLEEAGNDGQKLAIGELRSWMTEQGFDGLAVPVEYGGLGLSAWAQSEMLRRVALRSVSTAHFLATCFVFGPAALLRSAATPEQRAYWLPRLATGWGKAAIASFVVENDIVPIQAAGVVLPDEHGELPILRLNWSGARHALGPKPGMLILPFRLHDPDGLLGPAGERGVGVAIIETSTPGITHHCATPAPWPSTEASPSTAFSDDTDRGGVFDGHDVQLPVSCLLGGTDNVERALPALLTMQSVAKGISLPALSSASVSLAAHASSAVLRLQGEGAGCKMLGARSRLGRLAATTYRIEAGRRFLCSGLELGYHPALTASLFDISVFDDVRKAMADSMDLLGGAGPTPALTEWQYGLHELLPALFGLDALAPQSRNTRILALGLLRGHPYLVKELDALEQADMEAGCLNFDRLVWKHAASAASLLTGATTRAWTVGRFSKVPRLLGPVTQHYRRVNRYAAALAVLFEVLQPGARPVHAHNEPGLERLLRALAALVAFCAVLKRWQDEGRHDADLPLVEWCAADAWHTIDTVLEGILKNLNVPVWGAALKSLLLPPGMRAVGPDDAVTLLCAELLLVPSDTRERLVGSVWGSHGLRHLLMLERAYECVINVHDLREQIRQAGVKDWRLAHIRGGLTDAQARALQVAEEAVLAALRGEEVSV